MARAPIPASAEPLSLEDLDRHVRALSAAPTPSELFKSLLDASLLAAPRGALYLVRKGEVRGWGSVGYPPEAARRLRGRSFSPEEGWLARVAATEWLLYEPDSAGICPNHGQPAATECAGMAIRLRDRPIALLVVERHGPEPPWHPPLLSVFVRVAQMQLALDVSQKKPAPSRGGEEAGPAVGAAPAANVVPAAFVPEPAPAAAQPGLEVARRFARLVATDIRLYNEEAVVLGRRNRDLAERLGEQLARGREAFLRRHAALGPTALELLREAYVEVLAGGDESLVPPAATR